MPRQYLRALEEELKNPCLQNRMKQIRMQHPVFNQYPSIKDLADLIQADQQRYVDKDEILRVLIEEAQKDTTIFPLLNYMFWDSLMRLFNRKQRNVSCPDDLFSNIQVEFFHVVHTYSLLRRPRKIDVNLILDTKKRITKWQRDEIAQGQEVSGLDTPYRDDGIRTKDYWESDIHPKEMEGYLLDLACQRVITQLQLDLILVTRVHKRQTQQEWAELNGMSYNTVKNLRYRAETAIRKYSSRRK